MSVHFYLVLIAGVGWAGAQVLFTNILPFWSGARGVEFDWKYMQMAFDANITLVSIFCYAAKRFISVVLSSCSHANWKYHKLLLNFVLSLSLKKDQHTIVAYWLLV